MKNLKLFTILAFAVSAFVLTGCTKDTPTSESDLIVGTWVCVSSVQNGVTQTYNISDGVDKTVFRSDKTMYSYSTNSSATWNYTNGILKLTSNGAVVNMTVSALSSSIMILEFSGVTSTYQKTSS